jgi:hypothetical protein
MARRGTVKRLSIDHEEFIARKYFGVRQKSSGAVAGDEGDVRTPTLLIECKMTGSPGRPLKSKPTLLKQFEKVAEEAYMDARHPQMALRYYWPDSPLANREGWVDLTVKLVEDDT